MASLVYVSQSVEPISELELRRLIASAQERNRKEGVTGVLFYDQGRFLQWLEGPTEGVNRVWQSIRQDRRHTDISLVGESSTPARLFGDNAMALGRSRGERGGDSDCVGPANLPPELIELLRAKPQCAPSVLAGWLSNMPIKPSAFSTPSRDSAKPARMSLRFLIDNVIVPELAVRHSKPSLRDRTADPRATELARLLLAPDPKAAFALIDELRADNRSITQLCGGLFEPAARAMGDFWRSDDCSEFEVSLGLGHLQVALRRVSLESGAKELPGKAAPTVQAVLVAPAPREPHMLGSVIASEVFWRAGWEVNCEFPESDEALGRLVHDRWFDVLDLSLSTAFARGQRLQSLAESIRVAHANSLNPGLMVIVDGRAFQEQPLAYAQVGASASCANALDLISTAQSLTQPDRQENLLPDLTPLPS